VCGIIAVLRRPSDRALPDLPGLAAELVTARGHLTAALTAVEAGDGALGAAHLRDAAEHAAAVDAALRGVPGATALLADRRGAVRVRDDAEALGPLLARLEAALDAGAVDADDVEPVNEALVAAKDAAWAVARDRLRTADAIHGLLAGLDPASHHPAIAGFHSVQVALSAIDRLEVRGRDSAGLHLHVRGHGLDLADPAVRRRIDDRSADPLLRNRSVRAVGDALAFVYKAAAEIGELGDNVAALRAAITDDDLLHLALAGAHPEVVVLGHTRWASVGIISEANAHPLNHEETGGPTGPYVAAALNGDVDNHLELVTRHGLGIAPEITTDAKVIPTLVSRALGEGTDLVEAFRSTVASFEGSVAIAAHADAAPGRLLLALRGSGQALYVGLADDAFVVASEPYGVVEETDTYLRLDGETPGNPENPGASRGQIVVLDAAGAGSTLGIERLAYDGTVRPVDADDLQYAQITTRDIDRGDHPHFLLKEISEAPASFRKTLRGKLLEHDGRLTVEVGHEALPDAVRARLADGTIRRVLVIGQGTAAVAGQSLAAALNDLVGPGATLTAEALPATELSGFRLVPDMADTLVVAISQSGTTTDTNRTVDLVRGRGAAVVAIVNRRNSDLTDRSDGVLYTSDGRDVEMSVASTKAFYAQIAAGFLLAAAIAGASGAAVTDRQDLLAALRDLPGAMERVLERRVVATRIAGALAPTRRSWAVVGNGRNRIAAHEVRIKLSELCYKSIACDATEDKKHIDLSAEPMILVCAAGLRGSIADDVAKELAIYGAHKAATIAIVDEGEDRFGAAHEVFEVPATHPDLGFVLAAMAGHLFGYEAALAIDASARPLREARAAIESTFLGGAADPAGAATDLAARLTPLAERFAAGLRVGIYDGSLEAGTAVRTASLLRYATGVVPLDVYAIEWGKVGTPLTVVEDLTAALTQAIEELTRPVDAIKHQAKTVTVGISRSDDTLLQSDLVQAVLGAGVPRDNLGYRILRTLVALDPAIARVIGTIRYRIDGDPAADDATITVLDRTGIGATYPSRTETDPRLRGTKQLTAAEREVTVAIGRRDGRTVVLVPEVKGAQTVGITLLHVELHEHLTPSITRAVLDGYRNRFAAVRSAVTETEPTFDDARLADFTTTELLTTPVYVLADRWRTQ